VGDVDSGFDADISARLIRMGNRPDYVLVLVDPARGYLSPPQGEKDNALHSLVGSADRHLLFLKEISDD